MKEIIKKIKELQDSLHSHCCQVTCEQIIGMIEEEETKPFDPELLGFIRYHPDDNEYIKLINEWKEYYILTFHKDTEHPQPFLMLEMIGYGGKRKVSLGPVSVPNHRFGVELLKNLGVIE